MKTIMTLAVGAAVALAGCKGGDMGTGLNTVTRAYMTDIEDTWEACDEALRDAGLTVDVAQHDALGGEIKARRASNAAVTLSLHNDGDRHTVVSVRVEPGDASLANLLHERIATGLGLGEATSGWLGGASLEGSYVMDLDRGTVAATRTYKGLDFEVTRTERHVTWAQVDARTETSVPLRIRMKKKEAGKCLVEFLAGTRKDEDTRGLAQRMKDAFERELKELH